MRIMKEMLEPSREDAVRLTRVEKMGMIVLAYAATVLDDIRTELKERLGTIPDGTERARQLSEDVDGLLNDLRMTIPENQRVNLEHTAQDFEMRLAPKATPSKTTIIMQKEEFRQLVDAARARCRECTENDESCGKCELYQLLTVLLPLDDYHSGLLCPYNLGEWKN